MASSSDISSRQSATTNAPVGTHPSLLSGVTETTLGNGLKVVLKEARHAPIVCVSVWYRAGSKHETAGTTGLAHLLEHMMFKGTERFGKGEFDRVLRENGAGNNASTWMDRTNYYEIIASDRAEIALMLEADRMRGALFTEQDLIDEMPVVRNELERGEDDPQRRVFRQVQSTAFMAHPYHWPTIGWPSDVEAINAADIRAYYDSFYHPNNAFLVIVGDFDTHEMLALVNKHFAPIPRGPEPTPLRTVEGPQKGERRFTLREAGGTPYMLAGFRAPPPDHGDVYALDILSQILGQGRTSRFFESLVKPGLATNAQAFNMAKDTADPYLFFVDAEVAPGQDPADVEAALWATVETLKTEPVTDEELARAKKQNRVDFIYTQDRVTSQAFAIGETEISRGYKSLGEYLDHVDAVTKEDILRVAQAYLGEMTRTVGWHIPITENAGGSDPEVSHIEGPLNRSPFNLDGGPARPLRHLGEEQEPLPTSGGATAATSPRAQAKISRRVLSNGITVLVQENHFNQTVEVRGAIHAGGFFEGVPGLASLTAHMLDRGTQAHSADELARKLESAGAHISFGAGRETLRFSTRSITEDWPMVVGLLGEMLATPTFPEQELDLARKAQLNDILRASDSTYVKAALKAYSEVYGSNSPYSHLVEGSEESVKAISRDELSAFHRTHISGKRMAIVVVGDVEAEAVFEALEAALSPLRSGRPLDPSTLETLTKGRGYQGILRRHVEMADKNQTDIVIARRGLGRNAPDFYSAFIANFILGGDFTSRLNKELRDNQGLTYGTSSRFNPGYGVGPWVANIGVNPQNVEKAITGMHSILENFVEAGVSDAELAGAKRYLTGSYPVRLETNGAVAGQLLEAELFDLGLDYITRYPSIIEALTTEEVNKAIKANFSASQYVLVTAGTTPSA